MKKSIFSCVKDSFHNFHPDGDGIVAVVYSVAVVSVAAVCAVPVFV